MGNRGGYRPNSGRPKGVTNKSTGFVMEQIKKRIANQEQKAPLEILLEISNMAFCVAKDLLNSDNVTPAAINTFLQLAVDSSAKAAPYIHPKLIDARIEHNQVQDIQEMTTDQLKAAIHNYEKQNKK